MKEQIKKYKKLIPTVGYWTLSKVFGISIDEIFDILEYDNFDFITKTSYIISYEIRDLGRTEKYFENISGYWEKDVFINGEKIFHTNSKGKWVKYTYKDDKLFKKYFHDGHWIRYGYDKWGYRNFYEDCTGFWYKRKNTKQGIIISEINSNKKISVCI